MTLIIIENSDNLYVNSQNSLMDNSEKPMPINRIIHNLALNELIQRKELKDFSEILLNGLNRDSLFKQKNNLKLNGNDILFEENSILEMQNPLLKTEKLLIMPLIEMIPDIFASAKEDFTNFYGKSEMLKVRMEEQIIKWSL